MRLNKSTNHAIRILIECARSNGELTKVAQLSKRLDITQQNTFKIVHLLSKAGYLKAQRGRYGGVGLALPATDISIGQVVRTMELGAGELANTAKTKDSTRLHRIVDDALRAFIEVLDQNTLHDMVQKTQTKKAPSTKTRSRKSPQQKQSAKTKSSSAKSRTVTQKTTRRPKALSKSASFSKGSLTT